MKKSFRNVFFTNNALLTPASYGPLHTFAPATGREEVEDTVSL